MNFKIGVVTDSKLTDALVAETKRALQEISLKYKCQFTITEGITNDLKSSIDKTKSSLKTDTDLENDPKKGTYLSVGGEIDMD